MNKKVFSIIFIMIAAVFIIYMPSSKVMAATSNDGKWVYDKKSNSNGDYAVITKYTGDTSVTNITIPSNIDGIPVKSIEGCIENIFSWRSPFNSCNSLSSITIPNGVTSIGNGAFSCCGSLNSIIIPSSVTSIGDSAFYNCGLLRNIAIPNSVTSIGDEAFNDCCALNSMIIPSSVTRIGNDAFFSCYDLRNITIPNSVTSIGISAFFNCQNLSSITIPNSVTSIGISAFEYCTRLSSITIPNSVTSIGDYAFSNCVTLKSITISNCSATIGKSVFKGTNGLTINTYQIDPNASSNVKNYALSNNILLDTLYPSNRATVVASAFSLTPESGGDNAITLTVKDSAGNVDTTFNGMETVTILGVKAAPDGSYGTVNNENLDSSSGASGQAISLLFTNGQATCNLVLNDAENQSIEFNVAGVAEPNANTLNIKPTKPAVKFTSDTTDNDVDHNIEITFTPNSDFENSITGVSFNGKTLTSNQYKVESGKIILYTSITDNNYLSTPASGNIVVKAANYNDSKVQQTILGSSKCDIKSVNTPANSTINGNDITANVSSRSDITVDVNTSTNAVWKLYSDSSCNNEITNKVMNLNQGSNTAYIKVTAQNTSFTQIYTIKINAPYDSSINPSTANFDKYTGSTSYKDIPVTITLNGNTLSSIKNGTSSLTAGTDYSVSGNTVTISKAYLAKQLIGSTTLTFNFSAGTSQMLAVSVADTTPHGISVTVKFIGANGNESVNINNLDINSNGSNKYQFKLPNATKDSIVKAVNDAKPSSLVISSGSKSVTITFDQISSINDTSLENGIPVLVTIGTNGKIKSGQYVAVLKMANGSTDSNFDLSFTEINNSSITPGNANFDKYTSSTNYKDIPVTMNLNGNTLSSIKNGTSQLTAGTDYSVSGNIVTISKAYLAKQAVGTINLTFNFSAGNTQTLSISVSDTTPQNSSIAPSTANFDKYIWATNYKDITVTMNLNGNTLSSIKNGTSVLTAGTDYSVSGNTVTISKTYLVKQSVGTSNLTFYFSAGNAQNLAVSVADTTPYIPPYIPPAPVEETIPVSIEVGNGQQNTISVNAIRVEDTDGLEKETLNLDENIAKEIVKIASKNKLSEVFIVLPSNTEYSKDKVDVKFSKEFLDELAGSNISLNIEDGKAYLKLSSQTIAGLKDKDEEIDFNKAVETEKINNLISQLGLEAQVIDEPVSINNSFTGREKITMPIDIVKFSNKEDLEKYLSSLFVLGENSDGKIVVDKGTIQYDSKGNATGISVWVSGSEYFSLVQLKEKYFNGITTIIKDKVAANKEWHIKFTEPANPASITKDNVYVTDSKGNKVDVNVIYGSDNTLKVSPVSTFVSGETYYLYVTKNVTSKDRLPLGSETRVQFTVR